MTSIAVIIPTVGRPSLTECLDSVAGQMRPGDHLYVAIDVANERARFGVAGYVHEAMIRARTNTYFPNNALANFTCWSHVNAPLGMFGHPARNWLTGIAEQAGEDFCWSIDDDDIALPGALDMIRLAIETEALNHGPPRWFAFQTRFGSNSHAAGVTVWREKRVQLGDIGTPCIVMPVSAKSRWGTLGVDHFGRDYGAGYFGDFQLARDLEVELGPPVWVPHVVCEVRP